MFREQFFGPVKFVDLPLQNGSVMQKLQTVKSLKFTSYKFHTIVFADIIVCHLKFAQTRMQKTYFFLNQYFSLFVQISTLIDYGRAQITH